MAVFPVALIDDCPCCPLYITNLQKEKHMNAKTKAILGIIWRISLGIIALSAFIFVILLFCIWHEDKYGRAYWADETLSKNIEAHAFHNNCVRVYDKRTACYTTPKIRWISGNPERDSLTVYCDTGGNRGYINCNTGEIVIKSEKVRYLHAWNFSEGQAFVVLPEEDSVSIIDNTGKVLIRNVALYEPGRDYVFIDGLCQLKSGDKTGILSMDGTWSVKPKYMNIDTPNTFGYRIARNEEGYWLFNPSLELVYAEPYDEIDYAIGHEEGTGTLYLTKNHVKQLVNYDGSVVEPFVIDGTFDLRYCKGYNDEGGELYEVATDIVAYRVGNWGGLMNRNTGRVITPAIYTNIEMISKTLVKAEMSQGNSNEAVVMDKTGRIVKQ